MNDDGRALQWLVRALGRRDGGRAVLDELHDADAPVSLEDLPSLARRAAAMGLVAYRGPDEAGQTVIWLTAQGDQALNALEASDEL